MVLNPSFCNFSIVLAIVNFCIQAHYLQTLKVVYISGTLPNLKSARQDLNMGTAKSQNIKSVAAN